MLWYLQIVSVSGGHSADSHGSEDSDHGSHCSDLPQQSLFFEDHTGEVGECLTVEGKPESMHT